MARGIERLDATPEELEALVEKARVALDDVGYQKLMAAVRTLGYVTTLLEDQRTSLQILAKLAVRATDGEDCRGLEEIWHRDRKNTSDTQAEGAGARPSRRKSLSWRAAVACTACIVKGWRPLPGM